MSAWWAWSATSWHWILYILGLAAIGAVTGAVLYYRDPPGEAAELEHDLDAAFAAPQYLPGPVSDSPAARTLPMSAGASTSRVGEHHLEQPHYPALDPLLRPGWLEDQLETGRRRHARQMYMQGRWRAQMLAEIAAWAA
jgi:hypothetical protein